MTLQMQTNELVVYTDSKYYSKYVKLTPDYLVFQEAYPGKKYIQILEVQNCHHKPIDVSFGKASSNSVSLKTDKKNYQLSTGLKCHCKIIYLHPNITEVTKLIIPIYINDFAIDYIIGVTTSKPIIECDPCDLDFGKINLHQVNQKRTINIINHGSQNTQYSIDFGKKELNIIMFPQKGIIPAKGKVLVQVNVLGCRRGIFDEEVWIKCDPPQRIRIFGEFIIPKLITNNPFINRFFTLIDFSNVYFGQEINNYISIENYSSEQTMFFVESVEPFGYFLDVRKTDNNFRCFSINPCQGRIDPERKVVIEFKFKPIRKNLKVRSEYFSGLIRIRKLEYTDFKSGPGSEESDDDDEAKNNMMDRINSFSSRDFGFSQGEQFLKSEIDEDPEIGNTIYLNVFLHGEAEKAGITIEPFDKSIIKTTIGETVRKNIIVKNDSFKLPITVESVRMSGVTTTPQKFILQPEAYVEVTVEVTPKQMKFSGNLKFNLHQETTLVGKCTYPIEYEAKLSDKSTHKPPVFNMGITPKLVEEVGVNCEDIRYNTTYALPKCAMACLGEHKTKLHGNELIAFPNDRPKRLVFPKSSASNKCTTIYASIPRFPCGVFEDLDHSAHASKKKNNNYYDAYLRRAAFKRKATKKKPLSNVNLKEFKVLSRTYESKVKAQREVYWKSFVLCPVDLSKIIIMPKKLVIKNVAPNTDVRAVFTVFNENTFHIIAKLQSDETQLKSETLGSTCVFGNSSKELGMIFRSACIGKKIITVECILNESHIFKSELVIVVVPKEVYLDKDEIVINPTNGDTNYVELKNILNSPVEFKWLIEEPIFEILPQEGCIPPARTILCHVEYLNAPRVTDSSYVTLYSEGGAEKLIKATYQSKSISVGTDIKAIEFKSVPLSRLQTKYFTIRNFSGVCANFTVNTPQPIHGIKVMPVEGIIRRKGDQQFRVTAYFEVPMKFYCIISVHVERFGDVDIDIKGDSILPAISIWPNYINLRKIMPYSVDVSTFNIKNLTEGVIDFEFTFNDYLRDYFVSSSMNENDKLTKFVMDPFEVRTFYLHFNPTEVTVFAFFLPLITFDIFGPAILNEPKSIVYETYIKRQFRMYRNLNNVSLVTGPKLLDLLKITSVVTQPFLKFSSFSMNMIYHHDTSYKSKNFTTFEVSNITNDKEMQFCIRTDELGHPFIFIRSEGKHVDVYNKSIHCTLLPGDAVIFNVRFQPKEKEYGTFSANLPIYLKDFYECVAFNTIKIKGSYFKATISSNLKQDVIYFQPTVLKQPSEVRLKLNINYHFGKCVIIGPSLSDVQCHFPEGRRLECGKRAIPVNLTFSLTSVSELHQAITFECSCTRSKYTLTAHGCFENCIPTSYANLYRISSNTASTLSSVQLEDSNYSFGPTLESIVDSTLMCSYLNDTSFPLFPHQNDASDYANFMRKVHGVAENWLNTQALYNSKYRSIPDGISASPIELIISNDGKKSSDDSNPLLVQILINLGGRDARRYICAGRLSNLDEVKHVAQVTRTYILCLEYMHAHGGLLPHVAPEYLLSYKQFMVYKKHNEECLECNEDECEDYFFRRSKQCYVDVVLQLYKIFIFNRVRTLHIKSQLSFHMKSRSKIDSSQTLKYSPNGKYLLKWVEKIYETQKSFWAYKSNKSVVPKHFDCFENDFSDSLALATIFITYCPFLKDDLKDIYVVPENLAQLYHNANKICRIWSALKLSLDITPYNIVHTNMVDMLIIINYLHDVIQNYLPSDTVIMKAELTTTVECSIVVENHEDRIIWYYVMFFGKDAERFSSKNQMIVVSPRSNYILQVTYFAKTLDSCNATLVLCGEYPGHKYSKTLSTNLVGATLATESPETILVSNKIYEIGHSKLLLGKKLPGSYDLFIKTTENDMFELLKYDNNFEIDVPPQQYYNNDKIIINSKGDVVDDCLISSCPTLKDTKRIVFARNSENGDFHVTIVSSTILNKKIVENLIHQLPKNFENFACTCNRKTKFSITCLRTLQIQIPKRNKKLFNGLLNYLFEVLHPIDKKFCELIKDKPVFPRIIKYFVDQRHKNKKLFRPYDICFADVVKYGVKVHDKSLISIDFFEIPKVYETDTVSLPMHIDSHCSLDKTFKLTLTSLGLPIDETRIYSIKFIA